MHFPFWYSSGSSSSKADRLLGHGWTFRWHGLRRGAQRYLCAGRQGIHCRLSAGGRRPLSAHRQGILSAGRKDLLASSRIEPVLGGRLAGEKGNTALVGRFRDSAIIFTLARSPEGALVSGKDTSVRKKAKIETKIDRVRDRAERGSPVGWCRMFTVELIDSSSSSHDKRRRAAARLLKL